jgi:hypothetical protein
VSRPSDHCSAASSRERLADSNPSTKFPGGDPDEVRPPQSHGERQAGLNGLSGSPTSPPGRVLSESNPCTRPRT